MLTMILNTVDLLVVLRCITERPLVPSFPNFACKIIGFSFIISMGYPVQFVLCVNTGKCTPCSIICSIVGGNISLFVHKP